MDSTHWGGCICWVCTGWTEELQLQANRAHVARAGFDSESQQRKNTPIYSGPLTNFPLAIAAVARLCFKANEKHNPGEPLHWSRGKSTDHKDCIARHLIDSGTMDSEFDELHDVALAWRALANLQLAEEKRLGIIKETK